MIGPQRHSHAKVSNTAQMPDACPSCIPNTMIMQSAGWLSISTEGFAAMNAARPAEHLIKELVQNALDSFPEGQPGRIDLCYGSQNGGFVVECADNGSDNASSQLAIRALLPAPDSPVIRILCSPAAIQPSSCVIAVSPPR